jgi:hypothetical protein
MITKITLSEGVLAHLNGFVSEALSLIEKFPGNADTSGELNAAMRDLARHDRKLFSKYYEALHYLPPLFGMHGALSEQLSGDRNMGKLLTGDLPKVRVDFPGEKVHMDPWHQEVAYYDAPLDSFTVWVPFQVIGEDQGSVEFLQGSDAAPFLKTKYSDTRPYVTIVDFDGWDDKPIERGGCNLGEGLMFNHGTVHRSGENKSAGLPRCSLQFRFNRVDNEQQKSHFYPASFKVTSVQEIKDLSKNRTFSG